MPLLDLVSRTGRDGTTNTTTVRSIVIRLRIAEEAKRTKKRKNGKRHSHHYNRSSNNRHGEIRKQNGIATTTVRQDIK
jgi:hypothetical protein